MAPGHRGSEFAGQWGAAVRQERPSGQPGGLFLVSGSNSPQGLLRRRKPRAARQARAAGTTKLAGTQKACCRMLSSETTAERPLAFATTPAKAAPSANPVCWTVGTDEAATA